VNFARAFILMCEGARMRRHGWESALMVRDSKVVWDVPAMLLRDCNRNGSADATYRITDTDLNAEDWVRA